MNPFQASMKQTMEFHKSIREENKQKEVEAITGEKFPCMFKQQAGYPLENKQND